MATPAKKTTPVPAKKAPEPVKAPPPVAAKAAPAKAPERKPEPVKVAAKPEPKPKVETQAAPKKTAEETLAATARDRGWLTSPRPGNWDVVYMKSNPVLGGYENLGLKFTKSGGLFEVEHVNLNKKIPVPEDDQLDYAVHVLTGE